MQYGIIYDLSTTGDVTINYLGLFSLLDQIHIFAPQMQPIIHIRTVINNMA